MCLCCLIHSHLALHWLIQDKKAPGASVYRDSCGFHRWGQQGSSSSQHFSWKKQMCQCLIRRLLLPISGWCRKHCLGEDLKAELNVYWACVSRVVCRCALFVLTLVTLVAPVWPVGFMAIEGLYSVDHEVQYHPSCDWIIISRMGDPNSLCRHQPFPHTNINLHRKWNCDFAKTRSHRTLGVICLEVSAEIKNLSTYAVSITKQYLLLPLLIVYDVFEQCVEELCIPGIWGSSPGLRYDLLILFKSLIAQDENTIYMTAVAKRFKLPHLKLNGSDFFCVCVCVWI